MFKKIIAGALCVSIAASCALTDVNYVYAVTTGIEQQLEEEYREMEAELRSVDDEDVEEEIDRTLPRKSDYGKKEECLLEAPEFCAPDDGAFDLEAAFTDGEGDVFTDADPNEPTDTDEPDDPDEPEEPGEPDEPDEPIDPDTPINPEEPYAPEIPEGVREVTLEAEEGEDIAWKLNGLLIKMKERATDKAPCKVIIPPGNYTVTKTICTYSNIHIYAVGATITKVSPEKRMLLRLGNTIGSDGGYNGYRNVTIEGGTWDINYDTIPNKEEAGGCTGFRLGHATNIVIRDVTLKNNLKSHLLEVAGVKGLKVTGCTFEGYWEPYEGGAQECIQMDVCDIKVFPQYLPSDRSICEDIHIEGNTFKNSFAGVGCHSMVFNKPFKNIVIRNNKFSNLKKRAVWLTNTVGSVVENNEMKNVGSGVYLRSLYSHGVHSEAGDDMPNTGNRYPLNLLIQNNEISLNQPGQIGTAFWKPYGIYLGGENCTGSENRVPDGAYPISGVTVKNNKISGPGKGVQCVMAENCTVSGNRMTLDCVGDYREMGVILSGSSSNKVTGNTILAGGGHGIYIYEGAGSYARPGLNNTVSENTVTKPLVDGIVVKKSCDNITVTKNTVTKSGGNGIKIMGNSNAKVKDNIVKECTAAGITAISVKSALISGNTVSKSKEEGIRTEGTNTKLVVEKNSSTKNEGDGLMIGGGKNAVVSKNTVSSNNRNGISVVNSESVSLSENTIKSNKEYALIGTDSSIKKLKSNAMQKNGYYDVIYVINTSLPYNTKSRAL